jgi:nicotinamide-nucleotide amidase
MAIVNPRIELVCIGTELLAGKLSSHPAYIGAKLESVGLGLSREHTVTDDPHLMREVFSETFKRSDVLICSGGLGPTFDDLTRDVWSQVLHRPLVYHTELVHEIYKKFQSRGYRMPPQNRRQGYLLKGAQAIKNRVGTAPGQLLKANKKLLVLLPGPAQEMKPMVEEKVIPALIKIFSPKATQAKSFHLLGIPESIVDQKIRLIIPKNQKVGGCHVTYGILASRSVITVKFKVEGNNRKKVNHAVQIISKAIQKKIGNNYFSQDNAPIQKVVGDLLKRKRKTVAVAESCTGGKIAEMITQLSGSSDYFIEGATTYSNQSKINRLDVKPETLRKYGAVSKEVAREMASGIRKTSGADYTLSVTGIAGPTGATRKKPVGLVYIGLAQSGKTRAWEFQFRGDRESIRHRSAMMALELLRRELIR